jgi:hypothetical protein
MKQRIFGWCMDSLHKECRTAYTDWNGKEAKCECKCHKKTKQKKEENK